MIKRLAAVILAASTVFCLAQDQSFGSAPATRSSEVQPIRGNGRVAAGYKIVQVVHGTADSCEGSDISPADFRCFAENNYIYDPCWPEKAAGATKFNVVCPKSPWSKQLVEVTVRGSLSSAHTKRAYLWGLSIPGHKCGEATGATDTYHGKPVDFECTGDVELAGSPNRSHRSWTIREVSFTKTGQVRGGPIVHIAHAYFAASYRKILH